MLHTIYNKLSENYLNDAFELLINNEEKYQDNSIYWCLRGDLCCLINEFETAIYCYNKSLSLDITHTMPAHRLIEIYTGFNNTDLVNHYKENLEIITQSLETKKNQLIVEDLKLSNIPTNYALIKEKIDSCLSNVYYLKDDYLISSNNKIFLPYFFDEDNNFSIKSTILVPLNKDYIDNVRKLVGYGIINISVIMIYNNKVYITQINNNTLKEFKKGNREKTIAFHYLNESDSNVFALYNNIPEKFNGIFSRILLKDTTDFSINNMAKIPLLASISVSGHELFTQYPCPELMHNIEVGHGSMPLKACGALDKIPNFAFSPNSYSKVDTLCVSSHIDLLIWRASTEINPEKILISGNPRTDLLVKSNGRKNLERILKIKLGDKQIIFNMPTFHTHDNSGRVNGNALLNDFIKIPQFDYKKFDDFLGENNYICVLKVHHAEQSLISKTNRLHKFKNIYVISNIDLKKNNLDLYEVLNSGDLLITDYSSIYSDFLFMNKPIVFTNYDIEEYRNNRGLALEPYDFWTAGPKVQTQDLLQEELFKSLSDNTYYLDKRNSLKSVFSTYHDGESCLRIWEHINTLSSSKKIKKS